MKMTAGWRSEEANKCRQQYDVGALARSWHLQKILAAQENLQEKNIQSVGYSKDPQMSRE